MDGSHLRLDGDVKWGGFLQSLNTCFIRISPEELHNLIEVAVIATKRRSGVAQQHSDIATAGGNKHSRRFTSKVEKNLLEQ
jgi:hypothetical protein